MLTTSLRNAAAGLFVLTFAVTSHSAAQADWTVTSSCVGTWGMGNCTVTKRHFPRDPHVRHVRGYEAFRDSEEAQERDRKESIARDRKWLAFCRPEIVTDRHGVSRYVYARPGCEHGRAE